MAGGSHPKASSHKPSSSSSSSHRKSRWESTATSSDSKPPPLQPPKPSSNPNSQSASQSAPSPNSKPATKPSQHTASGQPPGSTGPSSYPDGPPPPPAYGFHMLERRTIVLADGSVRTYFALPPDYQDFPQGPNLMNHGGRMFPHGVFENRMPPIMNSEGFRDREDPYRQGKNQDYWNSLGLDGRGPVPVPAHPEGSLKRKFGGVDENKDEFDRHRQQNMQMGNASSNLNNNPNRYSLGGVSSPFRREDEVRSSKYMRIGGGSFENYSGVENLRAKHLDVDPVALKKAFLYFVKVVNETESSRRMYLEDGKQGSLHCVACDRSSKGFPDMHALVMHAYYSDTAESRVDHLGLHKALCVLMGWNYLKPPDATKVYQFLSADEAAANQEDLVIWPPIVIIHNTNTGKGKDGRMEGLGNRLMDSKLRDLGFSAGKSKSVYGRDGHLGITLVKFPNDHSGLREAVRLAEYFEKENHGRRAWFHVQPLVSSKDDEKNPLLVKLDEKTGEKNRVLYGYLGTAADLDIVDFDTRKRAVIESRREYKSTK